jgi:MFS family permease
LAWAGFNLCSVNYLYDATGTENRTRYLAYFNCGNGLAAGLGALLGGYLITHMPALRGYQILSIFLISGVLRGVAAIIFLPGLREVRRVSTVPAAELFHILTGGRPVDRRMSHRRFSLFHHHEPNTQKLSKLSSPQI